MATEKVLGDAIVGRLGGVKLDARAKQAARTFSAEHRSYVALYGAAAVAEAARSKALGALGEIDVRHDAGVSRLADKLVGAGVTRRSAPFAKLSDLSPSDLCALAYAKQIEASTKLTRAVRKTKNAPRDVLAVCDAIDRETAALKAGLATYDAAHKAWDKAIKARDVGLPAWQKALTRLRILAKASLIDDSGAYDALFAAPESIVVPRRAKKSKASPGPAAPRDAEPPTP